jgi:hypothetical protein
LSALLEIAAPPVTPSVEPLLPKVPTYFTAAAVSLARTLGSGICQAIHLAKPGLKLLSTACCDQDTASLLYGGWRHYLYTSNADEFELTTLGSFSEVKCLRGSILAIFAVRQIGKGSQERDGMLGNRAFQAKRQIRARSIAWFV